MPLKEQIDHSRCPKHIAIIMDGNGRWAQKQGQDRLFGHNLGVESIREVLKAAQEIGVKHLTLYAFSTENWNRPKEEVEGLMNLLVQTLGSEVQELHQRDVVIQTIGDLSELPSACQSELQNAISLTANNTGVHLILALNYGSRAEITVACRKLATMISEGLIKPEDINEELLSHTLWTAEIPDPELLIRTGGEIRISNFLLWQAAYSELYYTDVLWPDFKKDDLYRAVIDFQTRERRFGLTSGQLKAHE